MIRPTKLIHHLRQRLPRSSSPTHRHLTRNSPPQDSHPSPTYSTPRVRTRPTLRPSGTTALPELVCESQTCEVYRYSQARRYGTLGGPAGAEPSIVIHRMGWRRARCPPRTRPSFSRLPVRPRVGSGEVRYSSFWGCGFDRWVGSVSWMGIWSERVEGGNAVSMQYVDVGISRDGDCG